MPGLDGEKDTVFPRERSNQHYRLRIDDIFKVEYGLSPLAPWDAITSCYHLIALPASQRFSYTITHGPSMPSLPRSEATLKVLPPL
jgi:hypothetical protein